MALKSMFSAARRRRQDGETGKTGAAASGRAETGTGSTASTGKESNSPDNPTARSTGTSPYTGEAGQTASTDGATARATALERLTALEDATTPQYRSENASRIDAALDQLLTREAFSYDVNADPLYRQYEDSFLHDGMLAAEDATGRAAALSGGYGSSYATQAGQQAYGEYAQALADKVPSLYEAAYQRYLDEDDTLRQNLETLLGMDDTAYERYRDQVADAADERDYWRERTLDEQAQENYLTELYQKYPALNPDATTTKKGTASGTKGTSSTATTTTAANCEKFLAGLSAAERAKVYTGTDATSKAYWEELTRSLGAAGYEKLKAKYPA